MGRLYIHLFHGRDDPDQDMQDWGFSGPVLGPFDGIHITYMSHIRVNYGDEWYDVPIKDDMIEWRGKWYGDWSFIGTSLPNSLKSSKEDGFHTKKEFERIWQEIVARSKARQRLQRGQ